MSMVHLPDERARRHRFVAIDRATRWVFLRTYCDQTERSSVGFLRRVHKGEPCPTKNASGRLSEDRK